MAVPRKPRPTHAERTKLKAGLKEQYGKGKTIRELADVHGRSYGFVHQVLSESGATMRARGGAPRTPIGHSKTQRT
jgi:hypothetical protein